MIDAGLNSIGFLEPGVVGITFASGALGIKKGIEATFESKKEKTKEKSKTEASERELDEEVKNLRFILRQKILQPW